MPFLDKIVESINTNWNDTIIPVITTEGKFKSFGFSEQIIEPIIENNEAVKEKKYPGFINNDGEVLMIEIDDNYHIILYHKIENISNGFTKYGFGDAIGDMQETVNASFIVFAFRDKIQKPGYQLENHLKDAMLSDMNLKLNDDSTFQKSFIKVGNSSFDKISLLGREFSEVEINYPNLIVFETKYQIVSTYKKGCFNNKCGC
jgi:hypothetical protein